MDHFPSSSALTHLTGKFLSNAPFDIGNQPTVLPNLQYRRACSTSGALLIAGRPVRVFRLPGVLSYGERLTELVEYISPFAGCRLAPEETTNAAERDRSRNDREID